MNKFKVGDLVEIKDADFCIAVKYRFIGERFYIFEIAENKRHAKYRLSKSLNNIKSTGVFWKEEELEISNGQLEFEF
jgi:hypothetical protein